MSLAGYIPNSRYHFRMEKITKLLAAPNSFQSGKYCVIVLSIVMTVVEFLCEEGEFSRLISFKCSSALADFSCAIAMGKTPVFKIYIYYHGITEEEEDMQVVRS